MICSGIDAEPCGARACMRPRFNHGSAMGHPFASLQWKGAPVLLRLTLLPRRMSAAKQALTETGFMFNAKNMAWLATDLTTD
jgi:hypothetical protein